MKAFLLAAGEGRRLRPLTDTVPKCLVPIRGTPLLAIWLSLLERHGITDVLINLHHAHQSVRAFLASDRTRMKVVTSYEPRLLGSAGTVLANQRFIGSDREFLIAYADNLTNLDLTRMAAFHNRHTEPVTIGVAHTDRPREKGTVVIDAASRVLAFEEKAAQPRSSLANAGVYIARQALFDYLPDRIEQGGVLDFGHHVFPRMTPHLAAYPIDEFLLDIGTPDNYQRGQSMWPGI